MTTESRYHRVLQVAVAAGLSLVLFASGTTAHADRKDDYQHDLDDTNERKEQLQSELEGTDVELAETYLELEEATERLPLAEADLAAAEDDLAAAERTEQLVADRLDVAEVELSGLADELAESSGEIETTKASIGELARSTYRGGASLSSLHVVLDSSSSREFIQQTALTDRAVRNQTQVISDLETSSAVNRNREARQEAVRERVDELHAEAQEAVGRADEARAAAADYTAEIRQLKADKESLAGELEEQQEELRDDFESMQRDSDRLGDLIAEIEAEERRRQREAEAEAQRQREAAEQRQREAAEQRQREAAEQRRREEAAASRPSGDTSRPAPAPAPPAPAPPAPAAPAPAAPAPKPPSSSSAALVPPVPAPLHVTSPFGMRVHPLAGYQWMHEGVDLRSTCGETQVAAAAGTVRATIPAPGNASHGNQVIINHSSIGGNNYVTVYNHLTRFAVSAGQSVSQGSAIGYTGATGNVTGCHVHFEVWRNGTAINPMGLSGFSRRN